MNQKGSIATFLLLFVLGILVGAVGFNLYTNYQKESPAPDSVQPKPDTSIKKHYTNSVYGFSLDYPEDWTVSAATVKKGAEDQFTWLNGEVTKYEGIDFIKQQGGHSAMVQMSVIPDTAALRCGGIGPQNNIGGYKKLTVLGRTVMRDLYEEGMINGFIGHSKPDDLIPNPVMVKRQDGEMPEFGAGPDTDTSFVLGGCLPAPGLPFKFIITYTSDQFSLENIQAKKVDRLLLSEMDQILESLKID